VSRTIVIILVLSLSAGVAFLETRAGAQPLRGPYLGSYAATLTSAQAAARGDSRLAGRFTLVLRRNGTYTDSNGLDGRSAGRLEALGNHRLRFNDDSACKSAGFERPEGGVYRWAANGPRLTLRLVNEGSCTGRTDTLTFPVWIHR
jgi:hypothetical protein